MERGTAVKMIVGLGNPGMRYARTRHNAGFDTVDLLGEAIGWRWEPGRAKSQMATGMLREAGILREAGNASGEKLLLVKPQTYMNDSGLTVSDLVRFYKLGLADMLVICDDLDLPLGKVRMRTRGAAGGQHGLEDIIRRLGSTDFPRIKIGVGRPAHGRAENVDFLLSAPQGDERIELDAAIARAADAARCWLAEGAEAAMNRYNG